MATTIAFEPCGSTRLRMSSKAMVSRSAPRADSRASRRTGLISALPSHGVGAKYGPRKDGRVVHHSPFHGASRLYKRASAKRRSRRSGDGGGGQKYAPTADV